MTTNKLRLTKRLVGLGALASVFLVLFSVGLVSFFPWSTSVEDLGDHETSFFTSPWPRSLLAEERESRKKLRRLARAEQERRLDIQLRRMNFLNSTLFDFSGASGLQILRSKRMDDTGQLLGWPLVSVENRGVPESFAYFPEAGGLVLREGVLLRGGDELRFSASLTRERRNLFFYAFPLSEGSIRGVLGKYSFTNRFEAQDVRRLKWISHAINDETATQFRIRSVHGDVFILFGRVTKFEADGRIPVQLQRKDAVWDDSGEYLAREKAHAEKPLESSQADLVPAGKLREPLDELSNEVVPSASKTVAFGYNLLLVRVPSGTFQEQGDSDHYRIRPLFEKEQFRRFARFALAVPLQQDTMNDLALSVVASLATTLRAYGYHTGLFSSLSTLQVQPKGVETLQGVAEDVWLGRDDSLMVAENLDIERRQAPAKGLDAIFDRAERPSRPHLGPDTWKKLRPHLRLPGILGPALSGLSFDEAHLFLDSDQFFPRVVSGFQEWSRQHWQMRFFNFVDLSSEHEPVTTLQDLFVSLRSNPSLLFQPLRWKGAAASEVIEKTYEQLLSTLRARRLSNRTVVVLFEGGVTGGSLSPETKKGVAWIHVPGLKARNKAGKGQAVEVGSLLESVLGTIGVGQGQSVGDLISGVAPKPVVVEKPPSDGPNQEKQTEVIEVPEQGTTTHYRLTLLPFKESCEKVRWITDVPVKDLSWSNVKVDGRPEQGVFEFYPCSSRVARQQDEFWDPEERKELKLPVVKWSQSWIKGEESAEKSEQKNTISPWGGQIALANSGERGRQFEFVTAREMLTVTESRVLRQLGLPWGLVQERFVTRPHERLRLFSRMTRSQSAGIGLLELRR